MKEFKAEIVHEQGMWALLVFVGEKPTPIIFALDNPDDTLALRTAIEKAYGELTGPAKKKHDWSIGPHKKVGDGKWERIPEKLAWEDPLNGKTPK